VISRSLAARVGVSPNGDDHHGHGVDIATSARHEHWQALSSALIPYAMELADKASAAFALEVRYPFFDQRLVEFCLSIPAEQKLRNGWTRSVMRRAMEGIVPPSVQWRIDKSDLSPSFNRGLFERDREIVDDVVFSQLPALTDYVDEEAVLAAYRRWLAQPMRSQRDALTLYSVANLALWLRTSELGTCSPISPTA